MAEPVVTNLAVAAAAHAIMGAQNANDDEPERAEAVLLARVALEAGAAEIIAAAREALSFAHRFTIFPDSGVSELHCSTCGTRWAIGYHPSLDVLIEQARAHNEREHPDA